MPEETARIQEHVEEMLSNGVIKPSVSAYQSGILIVPKQTGDERLCVDFRDSKTVSETYPIPRIDAILDSFAKSSWFSSLDLKAGYWQLVLDPESRNVLEEH